MVDLIAGLLSPENIAMLGAAATLTAMAQGTMFAPIVDAFLLDMAIEQLGEQGERAVDATIGFVTTWSTMQTEADLQKAADYLALIVEVGAEFLLNYLLDSHGKGKGEGEHGAKVREGEGGSIHEPPVVDENVPISEPLPPGDGTPIELKPKREEELVGRKDDGNTPNPKSEEAKQPTSDENLPLEEDSLPDSPPTQEEILLENKQQWREEGEQQWQKLQGQIQNGQPYTGGFKSKEEFLNRYEAGQTFNSDTRSWGIQAKLRANPREAITHSTASTPNEILTAITSKTDKDNDKSLVPFIETIKDLNLDKKADETILKIIEKLGFGSTKGQPKQIKEDVIRHAIKEHYKSDILELMTKPDAHSQTKVAAELRESEPHLSKEEAMEKAAEQVKKQSEAEVEALLRKDPKLTREQAERLRYEQASYRTASEITEGLSNSDKGNLMEDWYDKVHGNQGTLRHFPIGEVDHSRPPVDGKPRGKLGNSLLERVRAIDRAEVSTVNGEQVVHFREVKSITGPISGENAAQFRDFKKIASKRPKVKLPNKFGGGEAQITGLTYAMTNPAGVAANAKFILKEVGDNENLSFEVFNKKGENMTIDVDNFDEWTVESLIKWANITH
jgi:hypothetical protein